ncbi:hypothetical protein [Actinoalloteichus sp. GBA129-24]|uniref:hypothetical protein n=1 Tax=Actinoalloteichus sp. GBA129-24 TaxID=1612551 RepID=UPI000950A4C2|nr:hypothetical protein [Actinoalloteichus sp. GBA129-24]APU22897.1 hypothetical protein UA75_24575 [Actinoalloteichus sp. GBA129-24]
MGRGLADTEAARSRGLLDGQIPHTTTAIKGRRLTLGTSRLGLRARGTAADRLLSLAVSVRAGHDARGCFAMRRGLRRSGGSLLVACLLLIGAGQVWWW